ncbi:FAD binding domain-containing protein [Lentithecium fluviatile CBS 122367]|uniref:FAD binding domain-containing protein n=1 Tax=Lentithecium fluviatile CBS 122367 TaxID=1168545 RepID=A0A6G1J2K4_9PLEO|nr:FAD binding domain-containing protein [Lentithecium fluviatile CBS 122367]
MISPEGTNSANGINTNGASQNTALKVLIVGAGIGGLTAAIALRKEGHAVQIFEQSAFARETGAAIHLAPNANGVLRRLGIFAESFGANPMNRLTEYASTGAKQRSMDLRELNKQWQHPWHLAHRIELHKNLKSAATDPTAAGSVQLHTSSTVANVDPASATVTLDNGAQFEGDLVIGADGVHSVTRKFIPGSDFKPFSSGKSAFRFLVSRKLAEEDPETQHFVQDDGELIIWYANDRRVVMYPTSNNTILNFVCIHPEAETAEQSGQDWDQTGDLDLLLKVYSTFDASVLKLLRKAQPGSIKVWKLLDMDVIPSWTNNRLALLGDSAHPFLPHQGQGAGVAIEDAVALAVVLPLGTKPAEVSERLKLYQAIRIDRATKIQEHSRLAGQDLDSQAKADMYGFTNYNFGHDEYDNASQRFREWQWKRTPNTYWRMPIAFGPMPGPRQTHYGLPRNGDESTFTTASIKFKTSRTLLQNLFPPGRRGWRFKNAGTVAYASFSKTTLNKMEWLGGSGYSHIGIYIHGVEYEKKDGTVVGGSYLPLLFESLTDPILSGREELGMPKLYTSVDIYRRSTSYRICTGWEGALWGEFHLEDLVEVDPSTETGAISGEADAGILAYKYIPKSGQQNKGIAAEEHVVYDRFDAATTTPRPQKIYKAGKASFKIDPLNWEELPTLHHIISRLAELPVYDIVGAKLVEGVGVPDVSTAGPIE